MKIFIESIRFYRRHPWFTLINLGGLSLGLAVFLLLHLFIRQQRSYDQFWEGYQEIYRVQTQWETGDEQVAFATAPPPLAPYLGQYEEVQGVTRLLNWSHFTMRPDNDSSRVFRETDAYIADDQFFQVFNGRLVAGSAEALDQPGNIALSESALEKYFGEVDPGNMIGRLLLGGKDAGTPWKITAIFRDMPANSHMQFDILIAMWDEFSESDIWSWNVMHTYIRTTSEPEKVRELLDRAVTDRVIPDLLQREAISSAAEAGSYAFSLTPLDEVHLQTGLRDAMEPGIRPDYLQILSLVALLVLFLACFNYMNISTALTYKRVRSVGIMKVHGATTAGLFLKYIGEYLVQSAVSLALAVGLIELMLLYINEAYGLQLAVGSLLQPGMILLMAGLVMLCAALSGIYPTWKLLHGNSSLLLSGEGLKGRSRLRNVLITGQFAISLFLIACTITLSRQLQYMQEMDPGYDRENVLVIQNDREIEEQRGSFIETLVQQPDIRSASFSTGMPALARYQTRDVKVLGTHDKSPLTWYESDEYYLATLDIDLVAGRGFARDRQGQAVINASAVAELNLREPVGAALIINEGAQDEHVVTVTGVMEDFHQRDFRTQTEPLIIEYLDNFIFRDFVLVRYSAGSAARVVEEVRTTWEKFEPDVPMDYFFFDTTFDTLFKSERILDQVFSVFSVLAIIIALIGLLGVVSITSQQRMREIGIRKVLGASSVQIVQLMLKQFAGLVILACIIALPVSWYVSGAWLNEFVFRIDLHYSTFIVTGLLVFMLAAAIVIALAWKSSRLDPVAVIRKDA